MYYFSGNRRKKTGLRWNQKWEIPKDVFPCNIAELSNGIRATRLSKGWSASEPWESIGNNSMRLQENHNHQNLKILWVKKRRKQNWIPPPIRSFLHWIWDGWRLKKKNHPCHFWNSGCQNTGVYFWRNFGWMTDLPTLGGKKVYFTMGGHRPDHTIVYQKETSDLRLESFCYIVKNLAEASDRKDCRVAQK